MTVLVLEEATAVAKRPRPTDEEIAAKKAAKLAARPVVLTWRQKFEKMIQDLGAESFVEMEPTGRILVNGQTVFFAHYRNDRSGKRWIARHPETALLNENRALTMAYYFPDDTFVHASMLVKGYEDQYNRRGGNLIALERLLKGETKHCIAVEAAAISEFVATMENTVLRVDGLAELLAPAARAEAIDGLLNSFAKMHPRDLSHFVVQDALVEAFIQTESMTFLREALTLPEEPTGDFASNDA